MSGVHWSDCDLEWLRQFVPELDEVKIYLRSELEIPPGLHRPGALAWTSADCDMMLKPTIEASGWWAGRGAAIVVSEEWHGLPCEQRLGILLHETSHILLRFGSWHKTEFNAIDAILHQPGGYQRLVAAFGFEDEQSAWAKEQHGADFVRIGLHLQRRSQMPLQAIGLFADQYDSPDPEQCLQALNAELCMGGDLMTILKTDPPPVFAALFG
jgi:hypothetical protein